MAAPKADLRVKLGKALEHWGAGVPENVRGEVGQYEKWERFTERAKRVLWHATEEAKRMNHNYIGTEHILLGLTAEGNGIAAKVLEGMEVSLDQVRDGIGFVIGKGDKPVEGPISLTPRAKRVVELSVDEARRLNHNYIGTEHVLLGLVREGEGVAAGVLENMGASLSDVRTRVVEAVASAPTRDTVVSCRVGSDDLSAIDLLVEAGIRSTRSDAAQWLIHAGIATNKALFDEVRGTVDEIRRLRDQARQAAHRLSGETTGDGDGGDGGEAE